MLILILVQYITHTHTYQKHNIGVESSISIDSNDTYAWGANEIVSRQLKFNEYVNLIYTLTYKFIIIMLRI